MNSAVMAKKLEAHLFSTAVSFKEYQDPSTLNARFQTLMGQLVHRRLQKAEAAQAAKSTSRGADPSYRLQVLARTFEDEPEKVRQIFFLVRQMEHLQVGKPSVRSSDGRDSDIYHPRPSIASSSRHTTTKVTTAPKFHFEGQQRLPQAVKDIFFEATIVDAFYGTPLERLGDLPWSRLIAKSQTSIRAYHSWLAESKA